MMIDLGENGGSGFVSLKDVSKRQGISIKYLEQITALLCKAGFLESLRGACGGYKLAFPPEKYKISMILKVTEETLKPVQCIALENVDCSRVTECKTFPFWKGLYEKINQYLESYTLKDLIEGNFTLKNNQQENV